MSDFSLVVAAMFLFALGIIASGCETAFFAADRIRLRHIAATGSHRARRALDLSADPERVLTTLLAVYTAALVAASPLETAWTARGRTGLAAAFYLGSDVVKAAAMVSKSATITFTVASVAAINISSSVSPQASNATSAVAMSSRYW